MYFICGKELIMNNQYPQQPQQAPQPQQTPQQPYPQQPQQQYYVPQKPYVDPAVAKKKKKDALDALGDKIAAFLDSDPILGAVGKFSDIIAYGAIGVMVVFSILSLCLSGGSIIFPIIALIFSILALSKKSSLPLAVDLSVTAVFYFVQFIMTIVSFARYGKWGATAPAGMVIGFIFHIVEMAAIAFLAYVAWTYFVACLPPKAYAPQQPVYPQQPVQPAAPVQPVQAAQPVQPAAPVQPAQPAQTVQNEQTAAQDKICSQCGQANTADAAFCKNCGGKL